MEEAIDLPPREVIQQIADEVEEGMEMFGLANGLYLDFATQVAERYARAAVLAERERCAKVAEETPCNSSCWHVTQRTAAAIRKG